MVKNVLKSMNIEVKTLDSIYPQLEQDLGIDCNLLVKLDTKGFDLEVLASGKITLSKALCSQVEVSFVPIYQNVPSYHAVLQKFEELGFYVTNFFPNMGSDRGLAAIDFDCFMVSKNHII
ncbi:FkbM family methyltransferase [Chamaesiphon polymorphus]|nr:FkbM family methyltransferase [Chamaesiphon polymorphus]